MATRLSHLPVVCRYGGPLMNRRTTTDTARRTACEKRVARLMVIDRLAGRTQSPSTLHDRIHISQLIRDALDELYMVSDIGARRLTRTRDSATSDPDGNKPQPQPAGKRLYMRAWNVGEWHISRDEDRISDQGTVCGIQKLGISWYQDVMTWPPDFSICPHCAAMAGLM